MTEIEKWKQKPGRQPVLGFGLQRLHGLFEPIATRLMVKHLSTWLRTKLEVSKGTLDPSPLLLF